jgi:YVTN family beta-propeller protein
MSLHRNVLVLGLACLPAGLAACGDEGDKSDIGKVEASLENRAYIVALESDELTVIDLDKLEVIAQVNTGGAANHMAELNADFTKVFVDSSESDETVVVDARALEVTNRIITGKHPTHLSLTRDGKLMAIMAEGDNAVTFLDVATEKVVKTLPGFYTPHFMRFDTAGKYGYVANIGAHHITRVDLERLEIQDEIVLEGFEGSGPDLSVAPNEGGFGDAQIAQDGLLYAAHAATGKVLVYDTLTHAKFGELSVGSRPWVAYAEHPFADVPLRHVVTNFGSATYSLINGDKREVMTSDLVGDEEAYGVNFNSAEPHIAYVMNRVKQSISVVDIIKGEVIDRIDVGGNTETASTTADGKLIVATVSSANQVVIIDAVKRRIKKVLDNVGIYPWSVTIPGGQNYCH